MTDSRQPCPIDVKAWMADKASFTKLALLFTVDMFGFLPINSELASQ